MLWTRLVTKSHRLFSDKLSLSVCRTGTSSALPRLVRYCRTLSLSQMTDARIQVPVRRQPSSFRCWHSSPSFRCSPTTIDISVHTLSSSHLRVSWRSKLNPRRRSLQVHWGLRVFPSLAVYVSITCNLHSQLIVLASSVQWKSNSSTFGPVRRLSSPRRVVSRTS